MIPPLAAQCAETLSDEPKQWTVPCRFVVRAEVLVEAATAEEARAKVQSGDWLDDGVYQGERVDWTIQGSPREDR